MDQATVVRLANDIARQFTYLPRDEGADRVAAHIRSFWDPAMRAALTAAAREGGEGLDPLAADAAAGLNR